MQEKTLLIISMVVAVLGLVFLLFYSQELDLQPGPAAPGFLPEEQVQLQGIVKRLSAQEKVVFLELEGERIETIPVVLFTDEEIFLKEGDSIQVSGTVEEYQGKKEVIASKVVVTYSGGQK